MNQETTKPIQLVECDSTTMINDAKLLLESAKSFIENSVGKKKTENIITTFECTVCRRLFYTKQTAKLHLIVHNFSSCTCIDCQKQMYILENIMT